jgi:hypothetical protein
MKLLAPNFSPSQPRSPALYQVQKPSSRAIGKLGSKENSIAISDDFMQMSTRLASAWYKSVRVACGVPRTRLSKPLYHVRLEGRQLAPYLMSADDPELPALQLSEPVVAPAAPVAAPTEPPWSPPPCTFCPTCSPSTTPAVDSQPPPTVASATPVSILEDPDKDVTWQVSHLTREALRLIWHQRLGHMYSRRVSDMHKYAIGVPNLPIATEIDDCPICLKAKLHKATQCNQGISIDFGFVVQSSKDSERVRRLSGLHGATFYVLLRDHFSNTLYGADLFQ